jgi:hypothetical protein
LLAAVFVSRVLRYPTGSVLLLLLAVLVRTDNVLLVIALLFVVAPPRIAIAFSAFSCALVALINWAAGSYPLPVLWEGFVHSKVGVDTSIKMSRALYIAGLRLGIYTLLSNSIVLPIALLGALAWVRRWPHSDLAVAVLLSIAARFFLYPNLEDRYFTPQLLLVIFALSERAKVIKTVPI